MGRPNVPHPFWRFFASPRGSKGPPKSTKNLKKWRQKLFFFRMGSRTPFLSVLGPKMVPEIDRNLASKGSSNRFSRISENLRKHGKGHQKSRFGEEKNNKKTQKIERKSVEKRGSEKEGLPRPILIDFWLISGPFWEQNGARNPSKKGSILMSKKGSEKNTKKSNPRGSADL